MFFSGLKAGDRVLDLGCGTGVLAVTAAPKGARVSGLDLSPALPERARYPLAKFGAEFDDWVAPYLSENILRQQFLMTRALKRD